MRWTVKSRRAAARQLRFSLDDIVAIHELLAMYGHVIDAHAWSRLDEVFVPDAVFRSATGTVYTSLEELRTFWTGSDVKHPAGHHVTNIVLVRLNDITVEGLSKGLYVHYDGTVTSATYNDLIRRTDAGWRLTQRRITTPTTSDGWRR